MSDQNRKIEKLSADNEQIKKLVDEKYDAVHAKYEKFRNIANATAKYMNNNKRITEGHTTLVHDFRIMSEEHTAKKNRTYEFKIRTTSLKI